MLPDVAIYAKLAILKVPRLQKIILKSLSLSLAIFDDDKNRSWRFLNANSSLFLGFLGNVLLFAHFFNQFFVILGILKSEKQKKKSSA